ncbi:MAG: oxygenase MpaB family protein [Propionibacteriales bacterium]|nr:oxygenase MpaB family protein [Propionibacteriales bacterium]
MSIAQEQSADVSRPGSLPLGPDSLVWRYFADNRMALLGPRAAVLQNMLPSLGQGVEDHSVWFAETLARLQRSIPPIFNTVYGADGPAAGHEVRDFHQHIKGKLPDGRPYSALNPDTYYWAHATFVEHTITATDTFIKRLSDAEKEQLFRESITWFSRYGVSAVGTPQTYAEFQEYWRHALAERLVAHRTAAYGVGYATKGWPRPKRVPAPVWFVIKRPINALSSAITIGGMPAEGREILGLPWDEKRERRYQRFAAVSRALNPVYAKLPGTLRMHPIALRAYRREGRVA